MSNSLKQILLNYINSQDTWVSKGSLYFIAEQEEYSMENVGRRLRELAEEGKILVSYYLGKRNQELSRYSRLGTAQKVPEKQKVEIVNGIAYLKVAL